MVGGGGGGGGGEHTLGTLNPSPLHTGIFPEAGGEVELDLEGPVSGTPGTGCLHIHVLGELSSPSNQNPSVFHSHSTHLLSSVSLSGTAPPSHARFILSTTSPSLQGLLSFPSPPQSRSSPILAVS